MRLVIAVKRMSSRGSRNHVSVGVIGNRVGSSVQIRRPYNTAQINGVKCDLGAHQCLSYLNRTRRDTWHFIHRKTGEECPVTPAGPLRATSIEALLPTVLEGLAIAELPEFAATRYFQEKQLEPILADWRLPEGGLYFVTPTARARPAKVSALADFLVAQLADARWSAEAVMGWKTPAPRRKQT